MNTLETAHYKKLISYHYGLDIENISPLSGYDNLNYKISDPSGKHFVLKVHHGENLEPLLNAEHEVLMRAGGALPGCFPEPLLTKKGGHTVGTGSDTIRILSWLEGTFFHKVEHTVSLFCSFGKFIAELDQVLSNFEQPVIRARYYDWDLQHLPDLKTGVSAITDPAIGQLVEYYLLQFKGKVLPELHAFRKSIIHNDANDRNVLVKENRVVGLIDFGDMVYAPLVQEVAVALTYIIMDKDDPLEWAVPFLKGFHSTMPLDEQEVGMLYELIAARLCVSLIHSFDTIRQGTADDYTLVSQKPAIDLLKKWIAISPEKASRIFRQALGMEVAPTIDYKKELSRRYNHIGKTLSVSYQQPVKMVRAAFQYMFDADGNTYLDAYNNIPHVGHQHPRVVEAAQQQMARLNTNTRYLYDQLAAYAERLLAKFPKLLNKVFFVNSGSEASDLAIRIAQTVTGHKQIAVLEHGYHGNTRMGIDISHYKFAGKGGDGAKDFVTVLPIPDTYRGKYRSDDGSAGKNFASDAVQILDQTNKPLAAFIAESIVGCGGQVPLAKDYLKHLYPEIRKIGGLCISDEVQVGFGRLGDHFWGFEMHDVVPDIVVLGKPMGNGHPIGAVVTTDEIAEAFNNGMEFFSSFGGNPVSCAIGMAVLDVIEEENLQQNALETGNYFMDELRKLQKEFPQIGDVRGSGLFIGIDLITDPETRKPNTELAQTLRNKLREHFILVSTDGPADNVIKVKPALCFDKKDVDVFIQKVKALM